MTDNEIAAVFAALWGDIDQSQTFPQKRPLLAHYTSNSTLESMIRNNEIWFSNPLYMNDLQELRFGILEGAEAFRNHDGITKACGDIERYKALSEAFDQYFDQYANKHAIDTYVFCLAEHRPENTDGLLSMWRGYGGNCSGVALIFDTTKLNHVHGLTPLIISRVTYATEQARREWIARTLAQFANLLTKSEVPTEKLYIAAYQLFERIKMFALFTKHPGFAEEQEWRAVYLKERDAENKLGEMIDYVVGSRGVEPKLKLKISPLEGIATGDVSLESLITQIILGPTTSHRLAQESVRKMLTKLGMNQLAERIIASTTPFRP